MVKVNLTASFDWIEFTVQQESLESVITVILKLTEGEFKDLPSGRFGYSHQRKWGEGNVFILFNREHGVDDNMGIHVIITGTGCREYEQVRALQDLIDYLIVDVKTNKFTRIDLAIDDHEDKIINYDRIHNAAISGNFTSRWNKWDELNSRRCTDSSFIGRTMYFGSQKSDIFVRIYDKRLERNVNGKPDVQSSDWTRLEIVYKKARAQMLAEYLCDHKDVGLTIRETLNNYIRFVTPSVDSNKARWKTAIWWSNLLGDVGKLKLTIQPLDRTIDQMATWLDKQIAPTIAAVMSAHDGDITWLYKSIVQGKQRLRNKHKDAIHQYQIKEDTHG